MDFERQEDLDGVRLPWNAFPSSSLDTANLSVPISCLFTPLHEKEDLSIIQDNPVVSRTSGTVLNPFCHVDQGSKTWTCPISKSRNPLPDFFVENPEYLREIMTNNTIEYSLEKHAQFPSIYLIIIDLATDAEDLAALKNTILSTLSILPENALIGLMTFGKHVSIYQLNQDNLATTNFVFNGAKMYLMTQLRSKLGLISSEMRSPKSGLFIGSKLFQPVEKCEFHIQTILDGLIGDLFEVKDTKDRKLRCTGTAISIAINLLETCFPKTGVEILTFLSGPANYGPKGKITTEHLKDHLRSHKDIQKAKYLADSKKFYGELASRACKQGYITNFFIGCLDQVGLYEMTSLSDQSGGSVIFSDSFQTSIFKNSLIKYLQNQPEEEAPEETTYGLNGSLEIKTSSHLKVSGLIGHVTSLKKEAANVDSQQVGIGGTNSWKLLKIFSNSTYAAYFNVNKIINELRPSNSKAFIQFLFYYQHPSGNFRLRVTTIQRPIFNFNTGKQYFGSLFDQEAAIVAVSRIVSHRIFSLGEDPESVKTWLDQVLVKLMKNFASINLEDNIELYSGFNMLPQFIYNLRRSFLLRLFNYSPDESVYYNHILLHEDTNNSLIIIQPTLTSYEQNPENPEEIDCEPVLLDSISIKPNRILLLDTFFEVLIYHGETIANWKKLGYQNDPEYADFNEFLQTPKDEVTNILIDRTPLPRFIDCDEGGSQSRFLYSKLNPTNSYNSQNVYGGGGAVILTDDISLQAFIEEITSRVKK